jgi:hypothetical protein
VRAGFGTHVLPKPVANVEDDGKRAYCVYIGKSGATGGVELDVFYPAADSPAGSAQVFKTVLNADPGATFAPEGVPGADESVFSHNVPQAGRLPLSISMQSGPATKSEILHLSQLVLERFR